MNPTPLNLTREEFHDLARQGNMIPVFTEIVSDTETPVSAFAKLDRDGHSFLLESAELNDHVGRFSFVGSDPEVLFESNDRTVTVTEGDSVRSYELERDPLDELRKVMERYRPALPADDPWFIGGAVGYIGYDVVRFFEPTIGAPPKDDLGLPDMVFMITGSLLIFDHRYRRLRIVANAFIGDGDVDAAYDKAVARIGEILEQLATREALPQINAGLEAEKAEVSSNTEQQQYLDTVSDVQEYIRAGDIFQIVPSQRFETPYSGDPLSLYRSLRFVNPSPYMFCLRFGKRFSLVGASPEVHVRAINGKVEIRPIAGTRRRGMTDAEDKANEVELLADPKERAEHLMLVDLARNDVGRIAKFKSVEVTDFMTVERYSHVMHIVSNVIGELDDDHDAYDVVRATFPAGTVSGAPKVRAMQIINEVEQNKRGSYAGVVGYFGFDGNLDSCIALRTVVLKDDKAYVQAGGGVVADSTPEGEYQETVNKAMGMMHAIGIARRLTSENAETLKN